MNRHEHRDPVLSQARILLKITYLLGVLACGDHIECTDDIVFPVRVTVTDELDNVIEPDSVQFIVGNGIHNCYDDGSEEGVYLCEHRPGISGLYTLRITSGDEVFEEEYSITLDECGKPVERYTETVIL